jgi:predicted TIM-barrel fold metal-dependent hydrolase
MIDTHAHVFEKGLPLAPKRRYAPGYDAPTGLYLEQLDRHGVSRGVLVQPSFFGTDCGYMLAALRGAPERLRGVAVIEPDSGRDALEGMDRAGVTGVRLNLIGLPDQPLEQSITPKTLAYVADLGWHVEVHAQAGRLAEVVAPLLERGLAVVVDHFGRPDPALGTRDPGFQWLLDMANAPRLHVKLSAPYRNWDLRTDEGRNDMRRAADMLLEAFSPARLMWGSDWPHTQFEASQTFNLALENMLNLSLDEPAREAVMSGTAFGFYRFHKPTR